MHVRQASQFLLLMLALSVCAAAQTLSEKKFQLTSEAEVLLDVTASAPGASW